MGFHPVKNRFHIEQMLDTTTSLIAQRVISPIRIHTRANRNTDGYQNAQQKEQQKHNRQHPVLPLPTRRRWHGRGLLRRSSVRLNRVNRLAFWVLHLSSDW